MKQGAILQQQLLHRVKRNNDELSAAQHNQFALHKSTHNARAALSLCLPFIAVAFAAVRSNNPQ